MPTSTGIELTKSMFLIAIERFDQDRVRIGEVKWLTLPEAGGNCDSLFDRCNRVRSIVGNTRLCCWWGCHRMGSRDRKIRRKLEPTDAKTGCGSCNQSMWSQWLQGRLKGSATDVWCTGGFRGWQKDRSRCAERSRYRSCCRPHILSEE